MVPETGKVGRFPSICPDGKCIQSVSSPGHPTSDHSVGSGDGLVVAFLNRLCCSDVLAPLIFRAGSVPLFHCSPLQRDLAPFGFPACKYRSRGAFLGLIGWRTSQRGYKCLSVQFASAWCF